MKGKYLKETIRARIEGLLWGIFDGTEEDLQYQIQGTIFEFQHILEPTTGYVADQRVDLSSFDHVIIEAAQDKCVAGIGDLGSVFRVIRNGVAPAFLKNSGFLDTMISCCS